MPPNPDRRSVKPQMRRPAAGGRGARIGRPEAAVDRLALVQVHPARCGGVHIRRVDLVERLSNRRLVEDRHVSEDSERTGRMEGRRRLREANLGSLSFPKTRSASETLTISARQISLGRPRVLAGLRALAPV